MSARKKLISIKNLSVSFGANATQKAVSKVSFHINRGEIFALVGESGSGKSVTAHSILRLLPETAIIESGSVKLHDEDIFALPEVSMRRVRGRRISMIFQEPMTSLNPVMTIEAQIIEVLDLHFDIAAKDAKKQVVDLLDSVGIPEPAIRAGWYPHQLSGGMKQRVMIAMALACEPDLLIADEPTTALDVTVQMQILELLKSIQQKRDLSILLITHDLSVVAKMADRIAVMRSGEILEEAPSDLFFSAAKHPYSRLLLDSLLKRGNIDKAAKTHSPLLDIKNLKVYFPIHKGLFKRVVDHVKAVDDVSLQVEAGKTLALVGESGSGKTTIAQAVVRLVNATAGSVKFDGAERLSLRGANLKAHRKDIQIVFQDPYSSLNPRMRVGEIIEEGMIALDIGRDKTDRATTVDRLLTDVGLTPEMKNRFPHEFSGGQRQRIAIARALAVKPKLIICDEPTSALDVSVRSQILDLLRELQQKEGLTYLLITHDMSVVGNFADCVAVMRSGKIVEEGSVSAVFDNPQQAYTKELLGSVLNIP